MQPVEINYETSQETASSHNAEVQEIRCVLSAGIGGHISISYGTGSTDKAKVDAAMDGPDEVRSALEALPLVDSVQVVFMNGVSFCQPSAKAQVVQIILTNVTCSQFSGFNGIYMIGKIQSRAAVCHLLQS